MKDPLTRFFEITDRLLEEELRRKKRFEELYYPVLKFHLDQNPIVKILMNNIKEVKHEKFYVNSSRPKKVS